VGLKGIQYVSKVATYLPVIPLAILLVLGAATVGGVAKFDPAPTIHAGQEAAVKARVNVADKALQAVKAKGSPAEIAEAETAHSAAKVAPPPLPLSNWGVVAVLLTYIIGFFATAGAAGTDFGMNNRDAKDVQLGGLVGIAGATIFAGGISLLIVAGAHGSGQATANPAVVQSIDLMQDIVGRRTASVFLWLLALAAFPPACFSAFIAANSFKTTLPKVNPFLSVGVGTLISIVLVVTGWGGKVLDVFQLIGASFGPICGAMAADYLLAGKKWAGPRAGFNPAGWISWAVGFAVGASDLAGKLIEPLHGLRGLVPVPPLAAMIVGFVLYLVLAKAGLESRKLEMPRE
jgi:cytosine permease